MPPALFALFGIDNDSVNLALNLLILFLAVIYLALIYWTYADAKRRIEDPVLVGTATMTALIPFVGPMIYAILRPPEFLEDVRERELETRASELRLRRLTETSCPRCEHPTERDWLTCPECRTSLKDPCGSCGRAVDPQWSVCPHCQSPVAREGQGSASGSRRPRRRVPAQGGASQAPPQPRSGSSRQASARAAASKRAAARKSAGKSSAGGQAQRRKRSEGDPSSSSEGDSNSPQSSRQRPASERSDGDGPRPHRRSTPTN